MYGDDVIVRKGGGGGGYEGVYEANEGGENDASERCDARHCDDERPCICYSHGLMKKFSALMLTSSLSPPRYARFGQTPPPSPT